ncbi:hypothetical protein AQJ66_11450 [Streptomyces bungoensis]|uniref:Uncharacterized protein n=1 Tax=Streptomyces bungoensis TaxID=285568 RepID=A0A117REN3_9ACTN|nr:hypothetical protein [Streptomyces bungoensis]KUN86641.1 hypothetical protein AQJ66_11450 [Streptomyces bungoensis]
MTNAQDLPDDEFRAAYTTAGGAYLLDRACTRLPENQRAVREPYHAPMAADRRTLREYVPGPGHPTSTQRSDAAVNALADKGAAELTEQHAVPGPHAFRRQRGDAPHPTASAPASLTGSP